MTSRPTVCTPHGHRPARQHGRWRLAALVLAGGLAAGVTAAPTDPGTPNAAPGSAPGADGVVLTLNAELERLRSAYAELAAAPAGPASGPATGEARKRAASRLMALLAARLDAERSPRVVVDAPVPLSLAGPPPHATADLDRLRDQLDGLASQQAALLPLAANLEKDIEAAVLNRRKAAEALRLRQELAERARGEDPATRAQEALQLARLEDRIAELEVVRTEHARASVRARIDALAGPIAELERRIAPARLAQRMDPDDLQAVRDSLASARERIAAERARVLQGIEQAEQWAATTGQPGDRALKPLRDSLLSLGELDAVEGGRIAVWEQRRSALEAQGQDAAAQRAASVALQRSIDQARAHAQAVGDRLELLKSEARVQRARVEALPGGRGDRGDRGEGSLEQRAAAALQAHIDIDERLQSTLHRLATLLQRSQADLLAGQLPGTQPGLLDRLGGGLVDALRQVWQYELFSATETVTVDGQAVALDYGVTVGKSLGVVALFIAGWWAAAKLARALIGGLVARGALSAALGRVLYRWLMTALLVAVLVLVLKLARVPLTAFAFLGGALAIGVGFGTQNVVKNLISGIIILFERKIRVGDIVTIGAVSGTVKAVDLRATTLRGFDGIETILPNSHLLENQVADWSHGDRRIRSTLLVTVAVDSDPDIVAARMLACAQAHPSVLVQPAPEILFDGIDPPGLVFKLWYWIELGGPQTGPAIGSDLRFAVTRALRSHGVRFARTQHDVDLAVAGARPVARGRRRGYGPASSPARR